MSLITEAQENNTHKHNRCDLGTGTFHSFYVRPCRTRICRFLPLHGRCNNQSVLQLKMMYFHLWEKKCYNLRTYFNVLCIWRNLLERKSSWYGVRAVVMGNAIHINIRFRVGVNGIKGGRGNCALFQLARGLSYQNFTDKKNTFQDSFSFLLDISLCT